MRFDPSEFGPQNPYIVQFFRYATITLFEKRFKELNDSLEFMARCNNISKSFNEEFGRYTLRLIEELNRPFLGNSTEIKVLKTWYINDPSPKLIELLQDQTN